MNLLMADPKSSSLPTFWTGPVILIVVLLCACAPVGPDFVKPELQAPEAWSEASSDTLSTASIETDQWWLLFNDGVLNELVESAHRNNNSLEIAGLRVIEARAQLGIVTGSQFPQAQKSKGNGTYISPADSSGATAAFWQYGLSAEVVWEMDFWGKFRRGIESADAAFLGSIAAYQQALVLLTSAVVDTYTVIRATEEQLRIAHENVVIQKRSYEIAAVLYANGADSELDMQQANTLLLATRATIPAFELGLRQARNALSTLLGQPPGTVNQTLLGKHDIPAIPADIIVGFPADMLRRRPDVRQAEMTAMAQNALVGLAEADLYPSFTLTGSIGLTEGKSGDSDFGDLFNSDALTFSAGPAFSWPFLNYGRIKNNVRVQDARLQQALINYREVVLQAARESEDAMAGFIGTREQSEILAETVTSAKRSNELSTLRYKEGLSDYQRVLDSQQALFTQQQRYVTARGDTVRNLVSLYKSLGGGWQSRSDEPFIDAGTKETMQNRSDWGEVIEAVEPSGNDDGRGSKVDW
jgi:NodT family efflux transporter outer membrane factor (OMF) lipoprotein